MRKMLIFIILFFFLFVGFSNGDDGVVWRKAGSVTIAGTAKDSIRIPIFTPDEWNTRVIGTASDGSTDLIRIPERAGTWGIYVYTNIVSLSTEGAIDIDYRRVDFNYATEDTTVTAVVNGWSWENGNFRIFNITQSVPVPFIWVIIERTSGDGTARFDVWAAYR